MVTGLAVGVFWGFWGFWLRRKLKLSAVEISGWMALSAGLILPRLFADGYLLALMCTCVSYAVMSSRERIANQWEMMLVSALCVIIIYMGQSLLMGVAGRLGTSAALSVLIFSGLKILVGRRRKSSA
ncbi:MAG TPA: hypothetical protein GX528_09190 [Firmicutes bacterium]|nr:hypothetical protein [Bacillota bacterium]